MKTIIEKLYLRKIPHEKGELSFQHPAFKGTYGNVAKAIDKVGLKRPNSFETASLVYNAFQNKDGKYESEIISILKNNWLWEFTGNLYLPKSNGPTGVSQRDDFIKPSSGEEINNGVILDLDSQNLKFENGKLVMDKNSLIKKLQSNDPLVKFVSFDYKIEKQSSLELSKNLYIVARYGEEGAEKIAKVADKYSNIPYVRSFNSVNEEKVRMSGLDRDWDFGDRLYVDGDSWDDGNQGHAFGVVPQKK